MENNGYLNVLFQIGDSLFMVSSEYVSDIQYIPDSVMAMPKEPEFMQKNCNSYGRIITMIDMKLLLHLNKNTNPKMLVILNPPLKGLMVDNVLSVEPPKMFQKAEISFASPPIIMILSRLVDTFSSKILYPMQLLSENYSSSVA